MDDSQSGDFNQPNGVALAKFLTPGIGVLSGKSLDDKISKLIRSRTAQNRNVRRPRKRAAHGFTTIMIIMRMRNQDGVGVDVCRKIIANPHSAGIRIDENLFTCGGSDSETGVGNVFYRDCVVRAVVALSKSIHSKRGGADQESSDERL